MYIVHLLVSAKEWRQRFYPFLSSRNKIRMSIKLFSRVFFYMPKVKFLSLFFYFILLKRWKAAARQKSVSKLISGFLLVLFFSLLSLPIFSSEEDACGELVHKQIACIFSRWLIIPRHTQPAPSSGSPPFVTVFPPRDGGLTLAPRVVAVNL